LAATPTLSRASTEQICCGGCAEAEAEEKEAATAAVDAAKEAVAAAEAKYAEMKASFDAEGQFATTPWMGNLLHVAHCGVQTFLVGGRFWPCTDLMVRVTRGEQAHTPSHAQLPSGGVQGWRVCPHAQPGCPTHPWGATSCTCKAAPLAALPPSGLGFRAIRPSSIPL